MCRAVYRCAAHASPNYNDNVSRRWRDIHHACLALGILCRRAITGLSNHFTARFCVCVCLRLSALSMFSGSPGTKKTNLHEFPVSQHALQLHLQLPVLQEWAEQSFSWHTRRTLSFLKEDTRWQCGPATSSCRTKTKEKARGGGSVEAKSEPFYYIKMFHTNNAYTLGSYCFRHKFLFLFEFPVKQLCNKM